MRGTNLRDGQAGAQRTMPRLKRWAPLILVPLLTLPMLGGLSAQATETHTLQSVAVAAGTDGGDPHRRRDYRDCWRQLGEGD